jgi:hypothetical protein
MAALGACSSDEATSSTSPTASAGATVTVRVSAAQGGTVSDKEGKVTLAIPPGALAADTDITLAVAAASNGSASAVYDFGPDGLQFQKPAALTLKGDGITVPDGKKAVVGLLDGATFKTVEGSSFTAGVATAPIMHFTKYAIVIVDGNIVLEPPKSCTDAQASFTNCGGDPRGTWKIKDYCIDPKILQPLKPGGCTDWVASIEATSTQTFTFAGTATSGTITASAGTSTNKIITDFSKTCYGGAAGSVTCASLGDAKTTCTDSATPGKCHCEQTTTKNEPGSTSTYPNADPTQNGPYCVNTSVTPNILTTQDYKNSAPTGTLIVFEKL